MTDDQCEWGRLMPLRERCPLPRSIQHSHTDRDRSGKRANVLVFFLSNGTDAQYVLEEQK